MGASYRQGFQTCQSTGLDPAAGDQAVHGMDREPVKLLQQAGERLSADSAAVSAEAAADGRQATLASLVAMLLACTAGVLGRGVQPGAISNPLGQAVALARSVADGDLSTVVQARGQDEAAELLRSLERMRESLARVVTDVRQDAEGVATGSTQIAEGNLDLSQRTEQQAAAQQQTAAAMDQLGSTVQQNADNARQANALALGASRVAVKGGEVVGQVVDTMKGINDSSRRIVDIIGEIDGIALQTNILALNAAVEAA